MTEEEILKTMQNYHGDNLESSDLDWRLEGDSELLKKIKESEKLDSINKVNNQYVHKRHESSCTKFSAINNISSMMNYDFTRDEINEIEDLSIAAGFKIGLGRSRGQGIDIVRKWRNSKFPNKEVVSFIVTLFSEEFWTVVKKNYLVAVSINVNSTYRNDVMTDKVMNNQDFGLGGGHATNIGYDEKNNQFFFVDSVGGIMYTCTENQLKKMLEKGCLRRDGHIYLLKNNIKMITPDVPSNQRYSEAVKFMVDNKLTNADEKTVFKPGQTCTRAEIAQFLKNFYEKFIEKK